MIHQYKLGGYNIVLDVCSGAVHAVDEVAYDIISLFEKEKREKVIDKVYKTHGEKGITKEDIESCYDEVASLKESGELFADDTFENMAGAPTALPLRVSITENVRL